MAHYYFVRQLKQLEKQTISCIKQTSVSTKVLLASYKVAFRVAQCKKPHTIAEELILPSGRLISFILLQTNLKIFPCLIIHKSQNS